MVIGLHSRNCSRLKIMSHLEPSSSSSMPLERQALGLLVKQSTESCLTSGVSGSQSNFVLSPSLLLFWRAVLIMLVEGFSFFSFFFL